MLYSYDGPGLRLQWLGASVCAQETMGSGEGQGGTDSRSKKEDIWAKFTQARS